ncbi:MAG: sulfurtransferase TusA family protein [Nitrospirae bacterium]|nr:MAG: sulfurtransferase TusA family protein [Nitrospirota bacterium]
MDRDLKTIEVDIRGQMCPATLLVALKNINEYGGDIRKGSMKLVFKTDNRDATVTIPDSAANMGYAVNVEKTDNFYSITIGALDARE